jgi:hypothetical protein
MNLIKHAYRIACFVGFELACEISCTPIRPILIRQRVVKVTDVYGE